MPVVRVSVYLPWRPADVYCDGAEYSSYQYGLHQYWISHSGLAGCPPAAYSNIVSRIVIIGAELGPGSLRATEYSQRKKTGKNVFASISPPTKKKKKASDFTFSANVDRRGSRGENIDGFGANGEKKEDGKMMESKNPTRAKIRHESVPWSLIHGVLLFFSSLPFSLSPSHTLGSQGNWCAAFDGKERPILTAKRPHDERAEKKKENG